MDITPSKIAEAFTMYIILHTGLFIINKVLRPVEDTAKKELQTLRKRHVKYHIGRFHKCESCLVRVGPQMEQLAAVDYQL